MERTGTALLRPGRERDAPALSDLVSAAYGGYVERIGRPPHPMTDDYAQVIRDQQVTVAEIEGRVSGGSCSRSPRRDS